MGLEEIFNIPNSIDYLRMVLLLASVFCEDLPFVALYSLSVGMDYFDGMAAKYFNQATVLGGCLDMVIDRVSTMVICFKIAGTKVNHQKKCIFYVLLDFISHFIYFISMILVKTHHKSFQGNYLLNIYYNNLFLKIMCAGSELCFIATYYLKKENVMVRMLQLIAFVKTFFHLVHFCVGVDILSEIKTHSD